MSNDPISTHEQVYALAALVRDGELSPEREHLVTLLHLIDTAAALAAGRGERYPDDPELAVMYAAATWEPVAPTTAGCSIR